MLEIANGLDRAPTAAAAGQRAAAASLGAHMTQLATTRNVALPQALVWRWPQLRERCAKPAAASLKEALKAPASEFSDKCLIARGVPTDYCTMMVPTMRGWMEQV